MPVSARASVLSNFLASIHKATAPQNDSVEGSGNLQTMAVLTPAMNIDPSPATGGGEITIVNNSALMPEEGPSGTIADIEKPKNSTISTYVVRDGDTLSSIAKMYGVTTGTILAANDLPSSSKIQVGEKLIILPITGIDYTVKKGDTLESIAKAYGGDVTEIASQNGVDDSTLAVGSTIIIPNGETPASASAPKPTPKKHAGPAGIFANNPREPAHNVGPTGTLAEVAYYIAPLSHYIKTQGIHGYNAVDLAAPIGTPIVASADGDVVVAKAGGWNGGYGSYVVISHDNGSQTLYGHMSKVATYDGAHVSQGQIIGYVGQSGEATGPHVHFEIRNGIRNPF
jgi:LysM repeat protein